MTAPVVRSASGRQARSEPPQQPEAIPRRRPRGRGMPCGRPERPGTATGHPSPRCLPAWGWSRQALRRLPRVQLAHVLDAVDLGPRDDEGLGEQGRSRTTKATSPASTSATLSSRRSRTTAGMARASSATEAGAARDHRSARPRGHSRRPTLPGGAPTPPLGCPPSGRGRHRALLGRRPTPAQPSRTDQQMSLRRGRDAPVTHPQPSAVKHIQIAWKRLGRTLSKAEGCLRASWARIFTNLGAQDELTATMRE